jgi:cellulose 1,4-beta-cellobiosidase
LPLAERAVCRLPIAIVIRCEGLLAALACAATGAACSGASKSGARDPTARAISPADGRPPASAQGNPFAGARFYVDPDHVARIESTIADAASRAPQLRRVESAPTAIWLDTIVKASSASRDLDAALAEQTRGPAPVVTVFVIYDLPERDCSARASIGELTVSNDGEARYETEFIDRIASQFRAHASQRIVAIVEPDSLANVATNLDVGRCSAAAPIYRRSIARAVRALSMPNVWLYLDAAHAGWLGWSRNRTKISRIFREVLSDAGGSDKIRGFATNVSNYDSLRGGDLARLEPSDPCPDELTYVEKLSASLAEVGITGKGFLVDTSRNGRAGIRSKSGSWCNVAGAGLGERPRASPAAGVDAYWWIKPPGDSDGGSDPSAPGYDEGCGVKSTDSLRGAPRAGQWFPAQFLQLVDNANPPV